MSDPTDAIPHITFSELLRRIEDDSVPEAELRPYLLAVPSADGGIDPAFQPNPSTVTDLEVGLEGGFIVNSLNRRFRRKRLNDYRAKLKAGWTGPRIVDEGDSWFQYPLLLDDIIDHLMPDHAILSLSGAGHTLAQMRAQDEVIGTIAREKSHVLLFSAGGNDLFENGNIANLVEDVRPGMTANDLVGPRFDAFVAQILGEVRDFLLPVHRTFPHVAILIHGYSNAFSQMDRWIGQPLRKVGVWPIEVQHRVVHVMVTRFNAAQKRMAEDPAFHGRLTHVDLTDLGKSIDEWYDEIHMSDATNKRAADKFRKAIRDALPPGGGGLESGLEMAEAPPDLSNAPVKAVQSHATELLNLDEDTLLAELQVRIDMIGRDPSMADLPSTQLQVLSHGLEGGVLPAVGPFALRLLNRWEAELYALVCGDAAADKAQRKAVVDAMGLGQDALVAAVTAWILSAPFAIPTVLAGVIAAILVKRFGSAALDELCKAWKDRLDA
jgi:hypothetical protein